MHRLHLEIFGKVQGVAFRAYTMREARSLGLYGWVRNRTDGSVEVLAEGEKGPLDGLKSFCVHGPPTAAVDKIEDEWLEYLGDLGPFAIRYG